MLRIAIADTEEMAKEIVFSLRMIYQEDFVFHYYTKLSQLNKDQQEYNFQVIFLHGKFDTARVHSAFVEARMNRLIVFCDTQNQESKGIFTNVIHMNRNDVRQELARVVNFLSYILKNEALPIARARRNDVYIKMRELSSSK